MDGQRENGRGMAGLMSRMGNVRTREALRGTATAGVVSLSRMGRWANEGGDGGRGVEIMNRLMSSACRTATRVLDSLPVGAALRSE